MTDTALPVVAAPIRAASGSDPISAMHDRIRTARANKRRPSIDAMAERFGVAKLRPLQYEAIEASLEGKDSLCILPTGGGKSVCYQLPAIMAAGLTVVVTPLIALMKDQVDALRIRNMPADCINSDVDPRRVREILEDARTDRLRLLYVSPERCDSMEFLTFLDRCKPRAFVIDEAHCVSVWGHEFRPAYAKLMQLRVLHPSVPVYAFTATATPRVRQQIVQMLGMKDVVTLIGDFDRPNLFLRVADRFPNEPDLQLQRILRDQFNRQLKIGNRESCDGIVYCNTRAETERVAKMLSSAGLSARCYHAGRTDADRRATQEWFMQSEPQAQARGPSSIDNRQSAIPRSSSPPSRSAWASTSPTCVS